MELKRIAVVLAGATAALLGMLWFLQGTGMLRICPILCFADCECVTGGSIFWMAAGAVAFIAGVIAVGKGIKLDK